MAKQELSIDVETPRLDAKMDELRELIRQANEVLKDLKSAKKEAMEVIESFRKDIEFQIAQVVRNGLDDLGKSMSRAIEDGEARVNRRFDKLGNILMGEEGKGKREPLADVVRNWMDRRESL